MCVCVVLFSSCRDANQQISTSLLTEWRVLGEAFHAHRLAGNHVDDGSISRLERFGIVLQLLAGAAVYLLLQLCELAGDVSGVAVQHRSVAGADLARVVEDDHLPSRHRT